VLGAGGIGTELDNIIKVSAGLNYSLALDSGGKIWAWGENEYGQLGNNDTINNSPLDVYLPTAVKDNFNVDVSGVISISAGSHHSIALDDTGELFIWGFNGSGELGTGDHNNSLFCN